MTNPWSREQKLEEARKLEINNYQSLSDEELSLAIYAHAFAEIVEMEGNLPQTTEQQRKRAADKAWKSVANPSRKKFLGILSITTAILSLVAVGCTPTTTDVTNSKGETNLKAPASQLQSDGCPYPQDLKVTDANGKRLKVSRVYKNGGVCRTVVPESGKK